METYRFRIVFINYLKNLCNLRNLWIKSLFGCGFAALGFQLQRQQELPVLFLKAPEHIAL
jgi:hypothetical protein